MKRPGKSGKKAGQLVLRIAVIVLVSLFLGVSIYSINARRVLNNLMPMPFGVGTSVVLSGSMEPTLSVNDLVFVRAAERYEVGDVVVYQSGRELIIHRIVRTEGELFVTRGDANNTEDSPITLSAIKGKMTFSIPFFGLVIRWLQSVPGVLCVCLLAVVLMHLSWKKEKSQSEEELDAIKEEIRRLQAAQSEQAEDRSLSHTNGQPLEPDAKSEEAAAEAE